MLRRRLAKFKLRRFAASQQSNAMFSPNNMYNRPYSTVYDFKPKAANSSLELFRIFVDLLLFLLVTLLAIFDVTSLLPTVQRGFFCSDQTLLRPFDGDQEQKFRGLRLQYALLSLALPLTAIVVGELIRSSVNNVKVAVLSMRVPRFVIEIYRIAGAYLFVLALEQISISLTQHLSGRFRPHFREVCQPLLPDGSAACANLTLETQHQYIEDFHCSPTSTASELHEVLLAVRHSFPSHAAVIAWSSMTFVALYLQARLVCAMWRPLRLLLQSSGLVLAALMSLQCICRNLHHWSDVFAGALIGVAFAGFTAIAVARLFKPNPEALDTSGTSGEYQSAAVYGRTPGHHYYSICGTLPQPQAQPQPQPAPRRRNFYK